MIRIIDDVHGKTDRYLSLIQKVIIASIQTFHGGKMKNYLYMKLLNQILYYHT